MGLLEACEKYYSAQSLYEVLEVAKTSSSKEIKKAYHKLSLKVHPDRASEEKKELATEKFQTLGQVYFILSDEEKRKVYDETGEIDDENDIPPDRDWNDYWRLMFPKITLKDIEEFGENYKESEEEKSDLKKLYEKFEGDMDEIAENLMCYSVDEEPRLMKLLKKMIKNEEVPEFDAFLKEPAKKRKKRHHRHAGEATEAEAHSKELGLDVSGSLKDMIAKKNSNREAAFTNLMSSLEEKYCKPKAKAKKRK